MVAQPSADRLGALHGRRDNRSWQRSALSPRIQGRSRRARPDGTVRRFRDSAVRCTCPALAIRKSAVQAPLIAARRGCDQWHEAVASTNTRASAGLRLARLSSMHWNNHQPSYHWRQVLGTTVVLPPTNEEIAVRAHAKYVMRGTPQGGSLNDWLEGEQELLREKLVESHGR
jgi:hypothetical protein